MCFASRLGQLLDEGELDLVVLNEISEFEAALRAFWFHDFAVFSMARLCKKLSGNFERSSLASEICIVRRSRRARNPRLEAATFGNCASTFNSNSLVTQSPIPGTLKAETPLNEKVG